MAEGNDNEDETSSALVKADTKVVITDVFGLGAAAKSAAGKEIAKSVSKAIGAIADPARVLLMGLSKTKVQANEIVTIAKAQAEARNIAIVSDEFAERMKRRVITTEIDRQLNIESTVAEAIEITEAKQTDPDARTIEDDWIKTWITVRGYELCVAIYEIENPFETILKGHEHDRDLQTKVLVELVQDAHAEGPHPVYLTFSDAAKNGRARAIIPQQRAKEPANFDKACAGIIQLGASVSERGASTLKQLSDLNLISHVEAATNGDK